MRLTAWFITVLGYVDSDVMVWKRQWFDFTSAATRTFNAGQCVVIVRDTSSLNPETAAIHYSVTLCVHLQGATLISNSMLTMPLPGRCVGGASSC